MTADALTPEARETLRKLAEKATHQLWLDVFAECRDCDTWAAVGLTLPDRKEVWAESDDKAFLAAAHPAAILQLLTALDEADKHIEQLDASGVHTCHAQCQKVPCVLRRERDRLAAELSKGNAAYEQQLHEREETEKLLQSLLNKVNRVTATWRHRQETWPSDLDELTERQIQVEQAHKTLNKHADDDAAGGLK